MSIPKTDKQKPSCNKIKADLCYSISYTNIRVLSVPTLQNLNLFLSETDLYHCILEKEFSIPIEISNYEISGNV